MNLKSKLAAGLTSAAIIAGMASPAFASTTIEISGNGKKSDNKIEYTNAKNVTVNQSNSTNVNLSINTKANTGGNKASGNTGGSTSITTGDATAGTSVMVTGGVNAVSIDSCGCDEDTTVNVKNNGKKSKNKTTVTKAENKTADQTSDLSVSGDIKTKAKTGKNKAKDNTNGDANVETGNSEAATVVEVTSSNNVLEI